MKWFFVALALLVGMFLPVQAGINTELKRFVQEPVWAAFISFAVGTVALLAFGLVQGLPVQGLAASFQAPLWTWTGGFFGAFFVAASVVLTLHLGATTMSAFIIAGQLLASLALDHYGVLGYALHEASPMRLLGAALVLAGAVLVRIS